MRKSAISKYGREIGNFTHSKANDELQFGLDLLRHGHLFNKSVLLVQHPEATLREKLRKVIESWGCMAFSAANHEEALRLVAEYPIQIAIISPLPSDYSDFRIMERLWKKRAEVQILMIGEPVISGELEDAIELGAGGAVIIPVRIPELKAQIIHLLRTAHSAQNAVPVGAVPEESTAETIATDYAKLFLMTTQLHHIETAGHIRRIGKFSKLMAELAGCDQSFAVQLGEAALLHDIGKLAIPDAILKKPGPLTPDEFEVMKTHVTLGGQILQNSQAPMLKMAHTVALFHHERWDGGGYPAQLRGEACPIEARIVGIVDVYDALTEERVYKKAWAADKVREFFQERRGIAFEARLVDLLLSNISLFQQIAAENLEESLSS